MDTRLRTRIPRQRSAPSPTVSAAVDPGLGFRPDIEGLRAVAVTLVVLSHAGVGAFAGGYVGVDVFFVISGFLITTLLRRERDRTGTISLRRFYARRAIRLLPVSTVVLVATLAASWLWLPATRFRSITLDALVSTFYGINWRLASEGTVYLHGKAAPSPLQHRWSLAVEEQFYLVWPLLLLAAWAGRRIVIVLGILVGVSLALSVQQTADAAPWAYFGSHTRAWELGAGALVALGAGALRRTPGALAAALTWSGLGAVLVAAVLFDEQTAFPGHAALLPVLGTAAVIAGGTAAGTRGAGRLIGTGPFRFVGRLSYGWYLWHWPVLMIWPAALARPAGLKSNLVFAVAALGLAWVTYHLVENPVRRRPELRARTRRGLGLGLALSAAAAVIALVAGQFTPPVPYGPAAVDTAAEVAAAADPQARLTQLIAASIGGGRLPGNLTPRPEVARGQDPRIYQDYCHFNFFQTVQRKPCVYGDPAGARTMFLIGDSHAAQWFPAVDAVARAHRWRLVALTKAACQVPELLTFNEALRRPYTECTTWREQTIQRVVREKPDLLVMASNDTDNGGLIDATGRVLPQGRAQDDPVWARGWQQTWRRFAGIPMVLLQDTPWPRDDAAECAAANARRVSACERRTSRAVVKQERRSMVADAARASGIRLIDPTPWFCTPERCPVVVGNILVYKDDSHMTIAYAEAVTPLLDRALFPVA